MKLLPTLRVIEMLCRSPNATLGLARDYLIRTLQTDKSSINEDERLIQQYRQETDTVREKIKNIKTRFDIKIFQLDFNGIIPLGFINLVKSSIFFGFSALVFQGSKCNVCNQPLELPSVHFLCLHSFHQQ